MDAEDQTYIAALIGSKAPRDRALLAQFHPEFEDQTDADDAAQAEAERLATQAALLEAVQLVEEPPTSEPEPTEAESEEERFVRELLGGDDG